MNKLDKYKTGFVEGERQREYERQKSAEKYDITELAPDADPVRKESCRLDLHRFLITYFPESTGLKPFGPDQQKMIKNIEGCILNSGRQVNAIFRGGCKSTVSENAAIWATLYGHRKFIAVYAVNKSLSKIAIDSIKFELQENDLLHGDFPKVTTFIRALDNRPQRAKSITDRGNPVYLQWLSDRITLPTIEGSPGSGGVIAAVPISKARGLRAKMPTGTQQRPDFAIIDDPQDDETANSPEQVRKLLGWIKKGVLRGGGHSKTISCVCNATVIERDDVVEQLLKDPAWQGERMAMVKNWPKVHETLWMGQYAELRKSFDRSLPEDKERAKKAATKFYKEHRQEMDDGAVVSWKYCYDPDEELSALQHAYNILIDDGEEVFASECQNLPVERKENNTQLTPDMVAAKLNHRPRGEIPLNCQHITAMIDVHDQILYWSAVAWEDDFAGYVVDYGTYPEQNRSHFQQKDPPKPLRKLYQGDPDAVIQQGLDALASQLLARDWPRVKGGNLKIEKLLIDQGYKPGIIEQVRRKLGAVVLGSKGVAIGASSKPFSTYQKKPGERYGHYWYLPNISKTREYPHVAVDVNYWKSFVHERLGLPDGSKGALTLYGTDPRQHQLFAEHIAGAEYWVETEGRGRKVKEWKNRPHRPDNHWLDCLVGCFVGASMAGCNLAGTVVAEKQRVSFAAMQRQARKQ